MTPRRLLGLALTYSLRSLADWLRQFDDNLAEFGDDE